MKILQHLNRIDESLNRVIKVTEMAWRQGRSQYQQLTNFTVIYIPDLHEVDVMKYPGGVSSGRVDGIYWSKDDFVEFAEEFGATEPPNFNSRRGGDYEAWEVSISTNPIDDLDEME